MSGPQIILHKPIVYADMVQGQKTVDNEDILDWMKSDSDPAFTTGEAADTFNMTVEEMRGRLEHLHQNGLINMKKPSKKTVLWWINPA